MDGLVGVFFGLVVVVLEFSLDVGGFGVVGFVGGFCSLFWIRLFC